MESIRAQTHTEWRLLVVDDCYPDRWLEPWLATIGDPRICYHRNEVNLGANATYVSALGMASSEYVVFMGADDRCLPEFLARADDLITRFEHPEIIQPGVEVIDENGTVWAPRVDRIKSRLRPGSDEPRVLAGERLVASLLTGNWAYFPSLVWKREVIERIGFRPFHVVQDLGLLVDVIREGGRLVLDPRVTFEYRRHAGSDSSVKTLGGSRFQEERDYCSTIAAELQHQGWRRAAWAARLRVTSRLHALSLVPTAVRRRDRSAAGRLIRHAAR